MEKNRIGFNNVENASKYLFDKIPAATAIYKNGGMEVVMANQAMLRLWQSDESVIGKSLLTAIPELAEQPFVKLVKHVFDSGESYAENAVATHRVVNGMLQTFYYDFIYDTLRDTDGQIEGVFHSVTDVTELVLAKKHLGEVDERLKRSLEYAFIGTWNFDQQNRYLYLDDLGRQLFGISEKEIVSFEHSLRNIHPDDVRDVYNVFLKKFPIETEFRCDIRFRIISATSSVRWLHCSGNAVYEYADDNHCKFAGIVRDVTKEVAGMEEQQRLQIQRDNFLSIASHELKTPVTSIKAYSQLLERMLKKEGDFPKADIVGRLVGQVNRLNILLEDLFDVSNIRTNRLSFNRAFYSFNEILSDVIGDINVQDIGHDIVTKIGFTGEIYCDKIRISQVVSNLISNAIKYSPANKDIVITTGVDGTNMTFSIKDYGIGISEENLQHVFDQFYRVSTPDSYSYPGLGLGLFISAEIIKHEHGKIWVESEEHAGSVFCFSLPLFGYSSTGK